MTSGEFIGSELWVGEYVYQITPDRKTCEGTNMGFDIIRPDWLQGTKYVSTNYLLRQPLSLLPTHGSLATTSQVRSSLVGSTHARAFSAEVVHAVV